jgi:farnesyl-diphosphate farnesyltransferase
MSRRAGRDLAYCHAVLPRVSRTFAANIGVLRGPMRDAITVAYLLCRAADALEDSWPGPPDEIAGRFARFLDALAGDLAASERLAGDAAACAGGREDLELVAHLPAVLRAFEALDDHDRHPIAEAVKEMGRGMRRYAVRGAARAPAQGEPPPYLDTEVELHDYCFVVAGCVGVMLTRLFNRRALAEEAVVAERLALAPIVGEALQLTNILLDWPRDVRRGRCYVPAEWLAQYRLTPRGLTDPARAGSRAAAKRLDALARAALAHVPEYLDAIPARHWRYRMFVLWPALWAQASLRHAFRDPEFPLGETRPRLPRGEVLAIARRAMLGGHSRAGVRKLFASLA